MTRPASKARVALDITGRSVLAVLGGYAFCSLAGVVLARWLPMSRSEAAITGSILAVPIFVGAAIWCFGVRSAPRMWLGAGAATAVLGALLWISLALEPIR